MSGPFQIGDVVETPSGFPWVITSVPETECPFRYTVCNLMGHTEQFEGQQMRLAERPHLLRSLSAPVNCVVCGGPIDALLPTAFCSPLCADKFDKLPPRKGVTAWSVEPMEENGDEFFVLTFHHGLGRMTRLDLWAHEVRELGLLLLQWKED